MKLHSIVGVFLVSFAGCALLQDAELGLDLLRAIDNAPAGQKACAAFNVLNTQADGASLSALVNAALKRSGSTVQFTGDDADVLLEVTKVVNCEFLSCFVAQVNVLDPPSNDADAVQWAQDHFDELSSIAAACPSPTNLTSEELTQLVRLVVAFEL